MYARSTTLHGEPKAVEAGIALVRDEVLPALEPLAGFVGASLLVDRTTGGCIATSAWESAEGMAASDLVEGRLRDRAQQVLGGRPEVRTWEVAVVHRVRRTGPQARARLTWTRVPPLQLDQQLYVFTVGTLPQIEDLPGFCSASLLVDRTSGTAVVAAVYESEQKLAESRGPASELRTASIEHMGATVLDVAELDVVLAHFRVPETV
jgi:hypothetical protein